MAELEAITLPNMYIPSVFHSIFSDFKQTISLNFSNHDGIRSHYFVKYLQLSMKGLQHRESHLPYMKNPSAQNLKCPKMSLIFNFCPKLS